MNSFSIFSLFLINLYCYIDCAKILGVFHVPSYSHHILGVKLLKPLAERGHEVTMVSPYKLKDPPKGWRDVVLEGFDKPKKDKRILYDMAYYSSLKKIIVINSIGQYLTTLSLEHENMKEFLQRNETFDLIVLEKFFNEALLGLAHHFKAPYVLLSTISPSRWVNEIVGNPGSPAYTPDVFLAYSTSMTFWERLHNTLVYLFAQALRHFYAFPKAQRLLEEHFPGSPTFEDLYYNASLILTNSHLSLRQAVPMVPNMIEIGGFHVDPPKKLPKDLQEFLDNAKEGVIYFSLGSNVQVKDMTEENRNSILRSFSTLKQKVLWKWEDDSLPDVPANVKISKWFPQQDILAHPNIVLFISHGGLLSTIEAITYGIPLMNIPIFAEQLMNAAEAELYGYGISVPYKEFTEEKFRFALNELLNNPSYRENAIKKSQILKDQQSSPLERAIFWMEYVIRHKGAPQLRSVTLQLKWYQLWCLDIIAFLVLCAVSVTVVTLKTFKIIKNATGRRCKKKKNNEKED